MNEPVVSWPPASKLMSSFRIWPKPIATPPTIWPLRSERAEVGGARHGVGHERAGGELAASVEVDVFLQDLANAHRHAADDLALEIGTRRSRGRAAWRRP